MITHRHSLTAVNLSFSGLTGYTLSFGGRRFLQLGDFRRVLRVVRDGYRSQIVYARFKRSVLFPLYKTFHFAQNMFLQALRQKKNADEHALQSPSYFLNVC